MWSVDDPVVHIRYALPPAKMDTPLAQTQLSTLTYDVVRAQLTLLRQHEAGTRSGLDPEDLHDMRVATRRLRAALRTFDQVLPAEGKVLYEELSWLGDGLAAVRDLDVQIERVQGLSGIEAPADREALEVLQATLRRDRDAARSELTSLLDSERYQSLLSLGADLLTRPMPERAEVGVGAAACALVERPYRRFRAKARHLTVSSPATEFHAVRRRARLLRYTVEFITDAFPRSAAEFVRALVALQDVLGKHQDAEVAIGQLRALADRAQLSPGALFALGGLAQRYADEAAQQRLQFDRAYRQVNGKRWRRLHRELRRAAAVALPRGGPVQYVAPTTMLLGEYVPSPRPWVRDQVDAFERSAGTEANTQAASGLPVVVVTMRGNKTGNVRKIALMRVVNEGEYALVASMGGAPRNPVWYYNLRANPNEVLIQDGAQPFRVHVRELNGDERSVWWDRAVQAYPPYAEYQTRTERQIPVFLATRTT
jgi:deazaflavin-dependent oxidoreductase (nitroreductase family)